MKDSERTFSGGAPNPDKLGFFSIRGSCGGPPDAAMIEAAAAKLGRDVFLVDEQGFECEIIAAAIDEDSGLIAYVQSRAKGEASWVDITIKIHLRDPDGDERSVDIESYNPYFGCDVRLMRWIEDRVLLVYREKHKTYACCFGANWPPQFVEVEDRWMIQDRVLAFRGYKADLVRRISIPALEPLDPISLSEAEEKGLAPPDPY